MSAKFFAAAIALVGLLAAPARADDVSAGVAPGPLMAAPAGRTSVTAVRVALAGRQIEVATALSVARGPVRLQLDLPRFGWLGEAETYPDRHFPELTIAVDGRPARTPPSFSAWKGGRDVTALVRAAGVDPFAVADTPPIVAPVKGKQPAFDALLAAGLVTRAPEGLLAGWEVQRHIAVPLSAGRHDVVVRYKARQALTLAQIPAPGDAAMWADFCLTPGSAAALLQHHRNGRTVAMDRYSIPVGVNGQAPLQISLRMKAPPAGALTLVCGANGRPAINAAGEHPVRAGRDHALHILYVSAIR
ncbi:hypothetical protein ACSBM8_08445 [Sphingomonas sp. ASY06-1R]|jgi:hypothetical protein|uniref:hypothetical protein n=1 Tax=Sphingomonas sp. ASY06-1R TaxID=3445771 RepID=UPI003FA204F4